MIKWVRHFLLVTVLVVVAGCAPDAPLPVEQPPPEVVALHITPAVAHWLPMVAECAADIPNFGVSVQVLPRGELSLAEADLILRLGERLDDDPFVAVMGVEEMVILAGADVPVERIILSDLQAIYAGTLTDWGDAAQETGRGQLVIPLSYPEGHELEILFSRSYLADSSILAEPQVFSTLDFLEKLLELHPGAIAYALASQLPEGARILEVTPQDQVASLHYVLAVTAEEPGGELKQLLLCLQNVQ